MVAVTRLRYSSPEQNDWLPVDPQTATYRLVTNAYADGDLYMTPGGEMARSAPLTSYEDEAAETQRAIATIGQKNTAVVRRRHTSNGTARTVADMCLSRLCRCIGTSDEKEICMASLARLDAPSSLGRALPDKGPLAKEKVPSRSF